MALRTRIWLKILLRKKRKKNAWRFCTERKKCGEREMAEGKQSIHLLCTLEFEIVWNYSWLTLAHLQYFLVSDFRSTGRGWMKCIKSYQKKRTSRSFPPHFEIIGERFWTKWKELRIRTQMMKIRDGKFNQLFINEWAFRFSFIDQIERSCNLKANGTNTWLLENLDSKTRSGTCKDHVTPRKSDTLFILRI